MAILITGVAGYIGSQVAKQFLEKNENIIILDNLSTGSKDTLLSLEKINKFKFIQEDLKNFNQIDDIFSEQKITAVMHFAASIVVPDSIENPLKYYMNNTANTINLISCCMKYKVKKFILSSTAAVYGEPKVLQNTGINENYQTAPTNPYGMSKLMCENVLIDAATSSDTLKYVIFRYFNVAGADMNYEGKILSPRIGQRSPNTTHLIKIAAECGIQKRNKMSIFGDDYNTHDGSCIRDYVHVDDLSSAHIKAINYLDSNDSDIFNIGYGVGISVKTVIKNMKNICKFDFTVDITERRSGDSGVIFSNNKKIVKKMHWTPVFSDFKLICASTYEWEKQLNET